MTNHQPRKGKGRSDGGQFASKGGPRASTAPLPKVVLSSLHGSTKPVRLSEQYPKSDYYDNDRAKRFPGLRIGEISVNGSEEHVKVLLDELSTIARLTNEHFGSFLWERIKSNIEYLSDEEHTGYPRVMSLEEIRSYVDDDIAWSVEQFLNDAQTEVGQMVHSDMLDAGSPARVNDQTWITPPDDGPYQLRPRYRKTFPDYNDFHTPTRSHLELTVTRKSDQQEAVATIGVGLPTTSEFFARWLKEEGNKNWCWTDSDGRATKGDRTAQRVLKVENNEKDWAALIESREANGDYSNPEEWAAPLFERPGIHKPGYGRQGTRKGTLPSPAA